MKKTKVSFKRIKFFVSLLLIAAIAYFGYQAYMKLVYEKEILKQMIVRLQGDSRIAEVLVTDVLYNPITQSHDTTIKFLEFDSLGQPLVPRYFTFQSNIIQFQSLVARFADKFIVEGNALRGKSVYLFWKVFVLDGANTREYVITPVNQIPQGYKVKGAHSTFEEKIWSEFWDYALNSKKASREGIKNAQIEAPGTKFIPGILYTLKIEHDGGIRIDTSEIPPILRGEKVLP
ncbi:MAG: hypothetical protein P9M07_04825 [Candidatus Aceula meridiana]|nr:hypothetical protein [Candidatus Aceula meridiana]